MRMILIPGWLAAVGCLFCVSGARADWVTYQGNAGHTGYVAGDVGAAGISFRWSTSIATNALGGMAVGDNGVFVKGPGVSITAVNESNGSALWSNPYTFGVALGQVYTTSAPAYANGTVYYQTDNEADHSALHGVSAVTGAQVFSATYSAQWETYLNPTPYGGNVYTGGGEYGGMYSNNGTTGAQNWYGTAGQYDGWTPAVDGKYAYAFTGSGDQTPITGQFRMFNLSTGVTSYQVNTGFNWFGYTMNSAVVLGPNNDAFAIAGSATAGALLDFSTQADSTHTPHVTWSLTDHYIGQPTLADGVLYVNDNGTLVALNELTGATLWSWTAPSGSLKGTMIATDNLLFATTSTTTYAIDLNTHLVDWSYGISGNLTLSDNMLFVAGSTGTLSAFLVPEPSTFCLTILGAIMLVAIRRPRRRPHRKPR